MIRRPVLALFALVLLCAPGNAGDGDGDGAASHHVKLQECAPRLDREVLERSLELGTGFLIQNQKPEGNFRYEYNWKGRSYTRGDNQVRQAGALWGTALIFQQTGREDVRRALERGLDYFARHTKTLPNGQRFLSYKGDGAGRVGGTALTALAHIDYLRAAADDLPEPRVKELRAAIDGYLDFLVATRRDNGRWYSLYDRDTGVIDKTAPSTSYFDGEALLALVKAARYLGRDDLKELVMSSAEAGYRHNVRDALKIDRDSDITKGYYQWASMAFFEIAESGWPGSEPYAGRVIELADWMIDVHRTLHRQRNTGYAYEGIVHAFELARRAGDVAHRDKFACTIALGMAKLTSWQIGSPIGNPYVAGHPLDDPLALGGVQNERAAPTLRIDVAQHQMHAVLLALRYVY